MTRKISFNVPGVTCVARQGQGEKNRGVKGCFHQTPLGRDGRDDKDERRSSKQREFCVISDLKLESTCQGSHESGPHCMAECECVRACVVHSLV